MCCDVQLVGEIRIGTGGKYVQRFSNRSDFSRDKFGIKCCVNMGRLTVPTRQDSATKGRRLNPIQEQILAEIGYQGPGDGEDSNENTVGFRTELSKNQSKEIFIYASRQ